MRLLSSILLAFALAAPARAGDVPPAAPAARVQFAFHSGFLMNLHHFLYNLAMHPAQLETWIQGSRAAPGDTGRLRAAVAFYRANYAQRDLLFDDTMASIKRALSVDDARRDPGGLGLAPGLVAALQAAAPVYARYAWPAQDAANRAWIARVTELDERYGPDVQAAIERALAGAFPRTPVRIDVVTETGKRQGAYTDTQAVIPAGRPSYQGLASLEMLYHEAAHVQTTDALEAAIARRLKAAGRSGDSELWHVLQFEAVGTAVADAARRQDGTDYVPYAEKVGLFKGYWAPFMPVIENDWKAWLEGEEGLDQALDHMVARLPEGL
jgi:hypothetical protein